MSITDDTHRLVGHTCHVSSTDTCWASCCAVSCLASTRSLDLSPKFTRWVFHACCNRYLLLLLSQSLAPTTATCCSSKHSTYWYLFLLDCSRYRAGWSCLAWFIHRSMRSETLFWRRYWAWNYNSSLNRTLCMVPLCGTIQVCDWSSPRGGFFSAPLLPETFFFHGQLIVKFFTSLLFCLPSVQFHKKKYGNCFTTLEFLGGGKVSDNNDPNERQGACCQKKRVQS